MPPMGLLISSVDRSIRKLCHRSPCEAGSSNKPCLTGGEAKAQESDEDPNDTLLVIGGTQSEIYPTALSCL